MAVRLLATRSLPRIPMARFEPEQVFGCLATEGSARAPAAGLEPGDREADRARSAARGRQGSPIRLQSSRIGAFAATAEAVIAVIGGLVVALVG
ncbi:MAG: hypothetical protein DYG90_10140, partial [Chloroflexi bacterium CFX6]|nr:hypothetical protein [Chloroflexi bacterium CFX6]